MYSEKYKSIKQKSFWIKLLYHISKKKSFYTNISKFTLAYKKHNFGAICGSSPEYIKDERNE